MVRFQVAGRESDVGSAVTFTFTFTLRLYLIYSIIHRAESGPPLDYVIM